MKKFSLAILITVVISAISGCSHLHKEDKASIKEAISLSQSQSVSQPKKKLNNISQWLFREPAYYTESYERGVYRVRDRK